GAALPADPEAWLQSAVEHPGSWWPDWSAWLASHAGAAKAAPKAPGNRKFKAIEPAPGRYVKVKA
ncbi:class I poly(R)-hydroxyalkanoic acid synthase, partial [Klebsiella quasipneumoniae]|nr:class I poly(R)-hydroxyalkanoic acid synthase [Klebsiella quasipneumoniae]